jgi:hypothetical protein
MLNDIIERRIVRDGFHRIVLEISADEYKKFYDLHNDETASEILNLHLQNRADDGRPSDVKMEYKSNSNVVKIFANIHYLGNDHTTHR